MRLSQSSSAAFRATEQRRSPARRLITPLFLLVFVAVLPLGIVRANDAGTTSAPAPAPPPAPVVPIQALSVTPPPTLAPPVNLTAGLTVIGEGGAAFYSPNYDYGGWDAIIRTYMRGGQGNPDTFPYSPEGYYCVHPDFGFGSILTLQNMDTGKTIRCTVADTVAPWDQGYWRSHFVIEISYRLFTALGLDNGNHVRVWALA
ncbi:MAG: septal ring lytic transglycosylase RlpA family protein [Thermomicrobia bacterium]|nr:septal ring lytic transglycosylase RlpA family protein [Thermomicrobia bacterium]